MALALRTATRLQDQDDVNVTPGPAVDGYALTWDNGAGEFVLASSVGPTPTLLDGLEFSFTLAEGSGTRYDRVASYALADNNTVTQEAGVLGPCALFTSANSESLSAVSATRYQAIGSCTWSFWLRPGTGSTQTIFSKYGGTANEFVAQLSSHRPRFTTVGTTSGGDLTHSVTLLTGIWYHIVMYIDDVAKLVGISIDNAPAETVAFTGTVNASDSVFAVGVFTTIGRYLNGRLWQLCKWNRLLTAIERYDLYNGGSGLLYPFE